MNKGTVKWFNNQKGYGFISDEQGNDVFVHYSGLNMEGFKSLEEGAAVEYEVVNGEKGPKAHRDTDCYNQPVHNIQWNVFTAFLLYYINQYHDVPFHNINDEFYFEFAILLYRIKRKTCQKQVFSFIRCICILMCFYF